MTHPAHLMLGSTCYRRVQMFPYQWPSRAQSLPQAGDTHVQAPLPNLSRVRAHHWHKRSSKFLRWFLFSYSKITWWNISIEGKEGALCWHLNTRERSITWMWSSPWKSHDRQEVHLSLQLGISHQPGSNIHILCSPSDSTGWGLLLNHGVGNQEKKSPCIILIIENLRPNGWRVD